MITKTLPDKWVRKAVYDAVNGGLVDGQPIPVFDYRTGASFPTEYVLMAAQANESVENSLCEYRWQHTLNIECYSRILSSGNTGSRLKCDEIAEMVLTNLQGLQLDVASGLRIVRYNVFLLTDFYEDDGQFIVASKIVQLNATIN